MEQYTFNELIERITGKLADADDETITSIYNQLFEIPIVYIDDDLWEEEIDEREDIIEDDDDEPNFDDDDEEPRKKPSKFDQYDEDGD